MLLASPSMLHMNKLIEKCVEFGNKWLVIFNAKKSVILQEGERIYKNDQVKVYMGDSLMPAVDKSKYLGLIIDTVQSDDSQAIEKFKKVSIVLDCLG